MESKAHFMVQTYIIICLLFNLIFIQGNALILDYSLIWGMISAFFLGTGKFEFLIIYVYLINLSWPNTFWWTLLEILTALWPNGLWRFFIGILIGLITSIIIIIFITITVKKKGFKRDITSKEGLMIFISLLFVIIFLPSIYYLIGIKILFTFLQLLIYHIPFIIISLIFMFVSIFYYFKKKEKN